MANLTAAALANRNKKHFLGVPAPLGYVAGVGRGYFIRLHIKNCHLKSISFTEPLDLPLDLILVLLAMPTTFRKQTKFNAIVFSLMHQ